MRFLICLLFTGMVFGPAFPAYAAEKLIVYTSMKESLIGKLRDGFVKKHLGIAMDYQSAGAGKLMAKIAAERESGTVLADVVWTSEVPDFYNMKNEGLLAEYASPMLAEILNPLDENVKGFFTPARLGTLGIAINTRFVKTPPAQWADLTQKEYQGAFGIANPSLSGTSYMSVALLVKQFGWTFIEKLRDNKAKIGKGSGQVIDDTASGDLVASLAVDYITNDKIAKGATLALVYPPEMLVVPSPVAIIKTSPNMNAAKKFVDFLLSKEGQTIIAGEGTLPVRADVTVPEAFKLPKPDDAMKRAIKIDYLQIIKEKENTVKKFSEILQGKS
ncbi:MAG: substrate-binding protein [Candidatus Desulfovibrio kirbyi]|jgi:iron(III) transport system substrate-binding protein|uniref:Substrate-binding protein n=1 Tax=Candidatus Desulfovibrio kirbyi TaxID=2696086 RepID=A0A6L2R5C7_9BACT|nr:extracellular solute-binding protein [Desulfovibrio sp.]GFH62770.1 MAG: substrate-binding protein [Candidatus Desulfovibrio kirbyi]